MQIDKQIYIIQILWILVLLTHLKFLKTSIEIFVKDFTISSLNFIPMNNISSIQFVCLKVYKQFQKIMKIQIILLNNKVLFGIYLESNKLTVMLLFIMIVARQLYLCLDWIKHTGCGCMLNRFKFIRRKLELDKYYLLINSKAIYKKGNFNKFIFIVELIKTQN